MLPWSVSSKRMAQPNLNWELQMLKTFWMHSQLSFQKCLQILRNQMSSMMTLLKRKICQMMIKSLQIQEKEWLNTLLISRIPLMQWRNKKHNLYCLTRPQKIKAESASKSCSNKKCQNHQQPPQSRLMWWAVAINMYSQISLDSWMRKETWKLNNKMPSKALTGNTSIAWESLIF